MTKPEMTASEMPTDPAAHYEAGKQLEAAGRFGDAAGQYAFALVSSSGADVFRHDLVMRAIFSMKMDKQHEAAIGLADSEMDNWQASPDYYFVLGDLLLDWATLNPETAMAELMPMVEASWLKCLELGEHPEHAGAVAGRGSYLAAHNLAVLYENLGDPEHAAQYRELAKQG